MKNGTATIAEKWHGGYNRKILLETGQKINVVLPIDTHTHALVTGSSGSGKSYALLYLFGKLVKAYPNIDIWVCDYKNSEDFAFLKDYQHYYAGDDCYTGILDYYDKFQNARRNGIKNMRSIMVFDEYPSFLNRLQMLDKANKTKQADGVCSAISELLMLGRGLGMGVWVCTQRADASLFKGGARDNFMVTLALGRLSKEQKGMVFPSFAEEIPNRAMQKGEGLLLADGHGLMEVKIPLIENIGDWKGHILDMLTTGQE